MNQQQQNSGSQQKQSGQSVEGNQTVGQGKSQAQFGQAGQENDSQSQERNRNFPPDIKMENQTEQKNKGMDDSKMRNAGSNTGSSGFESPQGQQRSSGNSQQNRPSGTDVTSGKMNSNQSSQNKQGK